MSISREFGETISECKKIQKLLNKKKPLNYELCLDVGHGDINSKNKKNYDPYYWLNSFIKESPVIHIKQVCKGNFAHLPFTKKNNVKGIIDAKKIINIINKKRNKETELAFELSFKERDPIDKNLKKDVIDSVKYWKKFIELVQNMNVIVTMAGKSNRFIKAGFRLPKFLTSSWNDSSTCYF
jgi:hypothetical protein